MKRFCVQLIGGLITSWSLTASADGPEPAGPAAPLIQWEAPPECPQKARVQAEIEAVLERPLSETDAQRLRFDARVERRGSGFEVEILAISAEGPHTRRLADQDCKRLSDAASFIIAIAIDPERAAHAAAPEARPDAPVAAPSAETRAESPEVPEQRSASRVSSPPPSRAAKGEPSQPAGAQSRPSYLATLAPAALVGPLPNLAWGLDLRAGLAFRWFELALVFDAFLPQFEPVPNFAASVEASLLSAGLRGCVQPLRSRVALLGCLGLEVGSIAGAGVGVLNARDPSGRWSAALLGLSVRTAGPGLFLHGGLEAGLSLEQRSVGLHIDGQYKEVFHSAPWVGRAFAGVGFSGP